MTPNVDIFKIRKDLRNSVKAKIKDYLKGGVVCCSRCGVPTGYRGVTLKKIANSDRYICNFCER